MAINRPLIGIQNPVIGYADPFHPQSSQTYMRTGEGQNFPVQDPAPSVSDYLKLIKMLGADFYMHHAIPDEKEISGLIQTLHQEKLPFILGNEFYSINGPYTPGTGRGEYPAGLIEEAAASPYFLGLLYDETEHRQLHSTQYKADAEGYEWADPHGKSADQIEADIAAEIARVSEKYHGCPLFSEHVFPVMYHTFCRGGMNPCPKLLKEEYQPLQIAVSLGAAKQYGRNYSVCVDLWGFDVGSWFTRLWGFPAHSPAEFESALKLAYYLSPYMMFVENIDPLAENTAHGFELTEFGRIYQSFRKQFVPGHPLSYSFRDAACDIAIIRSDDSYISKTGNFDGNGSFGSRDLLPDERGNTFFDVCSSLLHDTISDQAVTYFKSGHADWPAAGYQRTPDALKTLPLRNGVGIGEEKTFHPIFHPMPAALVFDQYVKPEDIGDAKLIIVCGSRLAPETPEVVAKKVKEGAFAIIAEYFSDAFRPFLDGADAKRDGDSDERPNHRFLFVPDFKCFEYRYALNRYLGSPKEWTLRFGNRRLTITNPTNDGRTLEFSFSG